MLLPRPVVIATPTPYAGRDLAARRDELERDRRAYRAWIQQRARQDAQEGETHRA